MPDIEGTGYTEKALDELLRSLAETPPEDGLGEEKGAELRRHWGVESGQVWSVGEHRYACGDNGDPETVSDLLGNSTVEAVVTDPPYEIDGRSVLAAASAFARVACILSGSKQAFSLIRDDWRYRLDFVWRRRRPRSFAAKNQPIFYHNNVLLLTRGDVRLGWSRPRPDFGTVIETEGSEFVDTGMGHGKSVDVFLEMLRGFEWKSWADPYAGTGASLLACEALGKKMFAVEVSPETTAVALQRFEDAGLRPELVGPETPG